MALMSDEDLIAASLRGEDRAFEELVERYLRPVYSFALRFTGNEADAEDIAQESFLKVWKNLRNYSPQSARFKTWLMHIVRNTAIDHLRKKTHVPFSAFEDQDGDNSLTDTLADDAPLPDEIAAHAEDVASLGSALQELSLPHREILLLYSGNDFSFQEIGLILGVSPHTIKSRYRRALAALRTALMHPKS